MLDRTVLEVPSEGIVLNYGGILKHNSKAIIHGGKVKLLHLNEVFPENQKSFNILYLVNSAPPSFALELVKWAKKHGAKFILNQNGVAYPAWAGNDYNYMNKIGKELIHMADYVIYQSKFCKESAERYLGIISAPSSILYNCVDIETFAPDSEPLPTKPWILLTAGSHQQPERIICALEALAILAKKRNKEVRLILAGRLDWKNAQHDVNRAIYRLGIESNVIFCPPYSQTQAVDLYRRAHILLHLQYKDSCPTVPIEAMACGVPVVGSNSGGMYELVGREGGILIDLPDSWSQMHYPDAEEVADSVEIIMKDIGKWREKARVRAVKEFNREIWMKRHIEIFKTVLS